MTGLETVSTPMLVTAPLNALLRMKSGRVVKSADYWSTSDSKVYLVCSHSSHYWEEAPQLSLPSRTERKPSSALSVKPKMVQRTLQPLLWASDLSKSMVFECWNSPSVLLQSCKHLKWMRTRTGTQSSTHSELLHNSTTWPCLAASLLFPSPLMPTP